MVLINIWIVILLNPIFAKRIFVRRKLLISNYHLLRVVITLIVIYGLNFLQMRCSGLLAWRMIIRQLADVQGLNLWFILLHLAIKFTIAHLNGNLNTCRAFRRCLLIILQPYQACITWIIFRRTTLIGGSTPPSILLIFLGSLRIFICILFHEICIVNVIITILLLYH